MSKDFERKDNHATDRIDNSWRKPRGSQNKQRLGIRGQPKGVDTGYRTKKEERHKWNGKTVITATSTDELDALDVDSEAARIPSMGRKKKTPLVEHAVENNIDVVNLDEQAYLDETEAFLQARKDKQEQQAREAEEAQQKQEAEEESEADEADEDQPDQPAESGQETNETDNGSADDAPTEDNTVKEIKAWLDEHDIDYTSSMLKADLLDLVDEHTEDES